MPDQATSEYAIVDVRPTRADETVLCQAQIHDHRWAQYVVSSNIDPRARAHRPVMTYLCRECLSQFLTLSEAIRVE